MSFSFLLYFMTQKDCQPYLGWGNTSHNKSESKFAFINLSQNRELAIFRLVLNKQYLLHRLHENHNHLQSRHAIHSRQ